MTRYILFPLALALSACVGTEPIEPQVASASTDFSDARQVTVELDNFDFSPRELTLTAGEPVELVFTNTSGEAHNFAAPEFFASAMIREGDADLLRNGHVELRGGRSASVFLVPVAGEYEVDCTHLGHSALGMTGSITVQ
ncbi:plastocyanin/azurin family copper-binding protein [Aurantiacibacter sediminis]|uniref:Cupredoxin domain-containing protein n=1 Tax=Aurantiacibacter sediminis TaxID=2793064 RepID=A0ABS0N2Y3_9SPHN|nr:plastocyanin/azurin family copper-binding protein [Aurantiacibacter sediminis]MBH5322278.1 cupredoxin domain-containing protein [Aurantiacibacter sediminis]